MKMEVMALIDKHRGLGVTVTTLTIVSYGLLLFATIFDEASTCADSSASIIFITSYHQLVSFCDGTYDFFALVFCHIQRPHNMCHCAIFSSPFLRKRCTSFFLPIPSCINKDTGIGTETGATSSKILGNHNFLNLPARQLRNYPAQ